MRFNASSLVRRIILWCGAFAVSMTAYGGYDYDAFTIDAFTLEGKVVLWGSRPHKDQPHPDVSYTTVEHGTVEFVGIDNDGVEDKYELTATPNIGYSFAGWTAGGKVQIELEWHDLVKTLWTDATVGFIVYDVWYDKDHNNLFQSAQFTFTPNFTNNVYTISFDTGVEGEVESAEVTYDKAYGALPKVSHEGKRLDGWYLNDKKIEESTIVKTADDHTLVARFSDIPYLTLKFNLNYEDAPENPEPMKFETGGLYSNLPVPAEREEYIFLGWYIGGRKLKDGDTVEFSGEYRAEAVWEKVPSYPIDLTIDDTVSAVYYQTKNTEAGVWTLFNFIRPPEVMSNSFVRLYAKANPGYTALNPKTDPLVIEHVQPTTVSGSKVIAVKLGTIPNKYKVTLDADGGSVNPSELEVTMDKVYGELPTPTKRGYQFVKWINEDDEEISATRFFTKADNEKLTAVWEANKYVVRFDANLARAIGAMDDIAAVYDSAVTLPKNAFYHADYTFVAWSLDKEVAEPLTEPLMNLASEEGEVVTFYAIWKKKAKDTLNEAVDADNVVVSGSDFTVTDESAEKGATSASARINRVNKNTVSLACSFKGKGIFSFAYRMSFDERDRGSLSASCNGNELTTDENWRTYSAVLGEDNKSTTVTIVMKTTLAGTNKWPKDDALIYLDDIRFLPLSEEELAAYEEGEEAWRRYLVTGKKDDATELKAKIALGEDGEPLVTWEPDLGASREYTVEGKEKLEDGAWHKASANDHFFRVSVELK